VTVIRLICFCQQKVFHKLILSCAGAVAALQTNLHSAGGVYIAILYNVAPVVPD